MFFHLSSIIFCVAAVSAFPKGQDKVAHPSIETLNNGVKILKLRVLEEDIKLRLQPAGEVISDDFTELEAGVPTHHSENIKDLKRKLYRNSETRTALHIDEDGPLTIYGRLNSKLWIEPDNSKRSENGKIPHRLDRIARRKSSCFKDTTMHSQLQSYEQKQILHNSNGKCVVIKYMFVVDATIKKEDLNDKDLKDTLSIILMDAQNMYEESGLNFKLAMIGMDKYNDGSEPDYITQSLFRDNTNIFNNVDLMQKMASYFCDETSEVVKAASVIFLMSKRALGQRMPDGKIYDGIVGVANPSGACDQCHKCGAAVYFSDLMGTGNTIAHETAHLLGSPHDGEGPERAVPGGPGSLDCPGDLGYIMGANTVHERIFSSCSKANINYFLKLDTAQCLFENCN